MKMRVRKLPKGTVFGGVSSGKITFALETQADGKTYVLARVAVVDAAGREHDIVIGSMTMDQAVNMGERLAELIEGSETFVKQPDDQETDR